MPYIIHIFLVSFLALNICCSPVQAASIAVSPSGSGTFVVQGMDMNGVAGIQLNLMYDSTSLATPSVTQGSLVAGALLTANTSVPGTIRIAIIRPNPFSGNGQIASISFASYNSPGGITSISANLIDARGANLPVQSTIASDASSSTDTTRPAAAQPITNTVVQTAPGVITATATTTPGTTTPGAVTRPADPQPNNEPNPAEPQATPPQPEPAARPRDTTPRPRETVDERPLKPEQVVEPKKILYSGVSERFKTYQGDKTPSTMMALFEKPVAPELRQEPAIAVSDGHTSVRIYVNISPRAGSLPSFKLSGAEMSSLAYGEESGTIILEVTPKRNNLHASVTIIAEHEVTTFPLTIILPAVEVSTREADFEAFLKDSGARKPKFDLNNDGIHDYLDDFVYTGQYLIKKRLQASM